MKKVLSIILVFVMLLTVVPFAYAEDEITYEVGDIIAFGLYPQSEVKDDIILSELCLLAPKWDEWISYSYYSGTGNYGSMEQGDWMRYIDILYNGSKYRGIMFTQYRPTATIKESVNELSEQKSNNYYTNTIYWFKYESIRWRVLEPNEGLIMCETIIDSQPYNNTIYRNSAVTENRYAYFNDSMHTNYASDYATSSIRAWLNNDFFNTAFTDEEKRKIKNSVIENLSYNTLTENVGYEKLDGSVTNDKIFLLSYDEVLNKSFGFDSVADNWDVLKRAKSSDYAKSQGLWVEHNSDSELYNTSYWTLRTPADFSYKNCTVSNAGYAYDFWEVYSCDNGVRPALRICNHEYTSEVTTESTHLSEGVKTFTCECGDTYTEAIAKLEDHTYTSEVTTEPTHLTEGVKTFTCACGDSYTEVIAKLTGHTYGKAVTEPTCTTKGYTTYTCACGDTYVDDYTEELDHKYTSEITTPATHLTEGIETFTCECGDSYRKPVAKLKGHTYTSEVTKEPTHLEEGEMTFTCECGDSYTEVIEKIAKHNYKEDVTEPTCTEKGYTTYTCECGDIYVADYTEAKGHIYSVTTTQPTCIQNGLVTTFCTSCGDTHTETLEPTGHSFAEGSSKCENCDFDKADDCSCNCHKGGISGFFFKIINFFQKLFGMNKTCACGAAH